VPLYSFEGKSPTVHPTAFVAPTACLIGDVTVEAGASVWFNAVLRADFAPIVVREGANVQDGSVLHAGPEAPVEIGAGATVGHGCVVHACTVMDNCRIGIGAVVLDGAIIEEGAQVGAGALVPPGKVVEAGWLVMGVPAKPIRKMSRDEVEDILRNARDYVALWRRDYGPDARR
jgi:carbonic anhydrase/acetyltransferase-like protein (isoleucine patch superfamily)